MKHARTKNYPCISLWSPHTAGMTGGGEGLPGEGSNLDCVIQSHVSYH